ncbi:hypothetical protein ABEB36_013413 [Hypothenemus hampei]|uniref:DUF4485 domain-containing protein n=1 Tax=Hypothenemus hampei TaxID=57062 RepID=A0ABD1E845_HYPHA
MANAVIALNDHFHYNCKIATTLQQFLPPNERKMIQLWFDKLEHMNKTLEEIIIRSDYMWFILLMLQNRKIKDPFTQLPPHQVLPLKKFIPIQVYEEVLIANEPNMIYAEKNCSDDILKIKQTKTNSTSASSLKL